MRRNIIIGVVAVLVVLGGILIQRSRKSAKVRAAAAKLQEDNANLKDKE